MILVNGLLKYPSVIPENNVYMFTANQTFKRNGDLVMGAGNARAFKKAYPGTPKLYGDDLRRIRSEPFQNQYMSVVCIDKDQYTGCLYVKKDYWNKCRIEDVKLALNTLEYCANTYDHLTFHLPYPGIGHGGLAFDDVQPYLDQLPDNVIVYKG